MFFKVPKNIPHLDAKGLKFTAQILCMLHHFNAYFHVILVGGSLVHQNIYLRWTRCSFPLGRTGQVIYLARRNHV